MLIFPTAAAAGGVQRAPEARVAAQPRAAGRRQTAGMLAVPLPLLFQVVNLPSLFFPQLEALKNGQDASQFVIPDPVPVRLGGL